MANRRKAPAGAEDGSGKAPTGLWVIMLVFFIGELLFSAWCRVQCVQTGYALSVAQSEQQRQLTLQHNLKTELERLKSPKVLGKKSRQLGLVMPRPSQMVVLK